MPQPKQGHYQAEEQAGRQGPHTAERGWASERTHESSWVREGEGIGEEVMSTQATEQVGGTGRQARVAHCQERLGECPHMGCMLLRGWVSEWVYERLVREGQDIGKVMGARERACSIDRLGEWVQHESG